MMPQLKPCLSLLIIAGTLLGGSGCAKKYTFAENSREELASLSPSKTARQSVSPIRIQMLRDTALSLGAKGGLAFRAKEINAISLKHTNLLQRIFNFYGMLLDDNVLAPVLAEGRKNLGVANNTTLRTADRNYEIVAQARFVTAPPTWRDYLILNYDPPEKPDSMLLPRNQAEQIVWKKYIHEGWEAGIKQADTIFEENVARLARDYKGMIIYRSLLAQNMVSLPYVANLELGVTGDDSHLNINDKVLRITALPELNLNSKAWKAIVTRNDTQ
jgi:defect-in-organelle-trafficking protein DotC